MEDVRFDEYAYDIMQKVSEITNTDYEWIMDNSDEIKGTIKFDSLITMLDDLLMEYQSLKKDFDEYKNSDYEEHWLDIWKRSALGRW